MSELKSDPLLIKNPFVCKSSKGVRLSLDKDPRLNKTKSVIQPVVFDNGNVLLHNESNPKLSYLMGKAEQEKEYIDITKYDYEIPPEQLNKTSKHKHTEGLPISFLQIKTEEEGIDWYANNYPKIPADLLPIIARYHWGEPITKKGLKNERKKIIKKSGENKLISKTKEQNNNKPFKISFD